LGTARRAEQQGPASGRRHGQEFDAGQTLQFGVPIKQVAQQKGTRQLMDRLVKWSRPVTVAAGGPEAHTAATLAGGPWNPAHFFAELAADRHGWAEDLPLVARSRALYPVGGG
jgi:hypothetical protein